ncbi:hypothetical protein [Crocosphaera sp.]|uniref:hypothetical protein n=1 Tax=Crocosphaera sp. TaxID=2729996 RepID=UPI003F222531
MSNNKPQNQLSFVRETLEIIKQYNTESVLQALQKRYKTSSRNNIPLLHYLQNIRDDKGIILPLDPITQINTCIKILQEYLIYLEANKISEKDIIDNLTEIRNCFEMIFHQGLSKKFKTYRNDTRDQETNVFSIPLEHLKFYISILKQIEIRYPTYTIQEDELIQYQEIINELLDNIKKSNIQDNLKSKIIKNLLEIKQMLDNIYAFSCNDIEKQIISNYYWWSQLNDDDQGFQENRKKFLEFTKDFMNNIVSRIKDPTFISENLVRTLISAEVGEMVKKLPEFIDKINPNN